MSIPYEELFVLVLLLVGVVGIYYALKLHYIFAFRLVKNTSLSFEKKKKIEKIQPYVFIFLKVLLTVALFIVLILGIQYLMDGQSLKVFIFETWETVPEGFWLLVLWTLLRIALLIIVAKILLKIIYRFLDKQEEKTKLKNRYNDENVKRVYVRLHETIKYTFVLGVIYRIISFFPFLLEVSYVALAVLILFFTFSMGLTLKEVYLMHKTRK